MKNVTPVSDQDIDVEGPARDDHAPALSRGGPVVPLGTDPAWDQARHLLKVGRSNARALAKEIERIRLVYLGQGHGGAGRGNQYSPAKVPSFTSVKLGTAKGFVSKLRDELGLHPQQAKRLMDAAEYEARIEAVALAKPGETITWEDDEGPHSFRVCEDSIEVARDHLASMGLPGGPRAAAAWAGVATAVKTRGKVRAPINHYANLARGMRALATSLEEWLRLKGTDRAKLDAAWIEMLEAGIVPDTFIEAVLTRYGSDRRR